MQHFVNHTALERMAAEIISGPRARAYVLALLTAAIWLSTGLVLAAIWLALALIVEGSRTALLARIGPPSARAPRLALDIASAASLATAPALAWFGPGDVGPALAVALLCVLLVHTATQSPHGRIDTLLICTPYAVSALAFAYAGIASPMGVAACGLAGGYVFLVTLQQRRQSDHAHKLNAEWVRQLNMSFEEKPHAAWEIDFARRTLSGGAQLGALLGRVIDFDDIVERACFAAPEDRDLAQSLLAPAPGAARRFAFEYNALKPDGSRLRLRHQGFVHTALDGAATRIFCVTEPASIAASAANEDSILEAALLQIETILDGQERTLTMLRNEIGKAAPAPGAVIALGQAPSRGVERLAHNVALADRRRVAIAEAVQVLVRARDDSDAANLAKSQFLANMSHELRTPLNAVIGYAEMLQEDAEDRGDDAATKDLDRILNAANHLLSLLNEVLDLSKIEAGRVDVVPAPFDPADMLDDALSTMAPLAARNNNTITFSAPEAPLQANSDVSKLNQCVLNLLSNACKFTRDGKIDVALSEQSQAGARMLQIVVSDTGIGMSGAHMAKLFQPFVQADPTITQRYGGTGLGLTITRKLANLLGGEVTVTSEEARGSAFTLTIPANFADIPTLQGAAAQIDPVQGAPDAPLVLVIEDEPDARELAARALTRAGFAVQGVGGGEAGLTLARAKMPALVLLDIFLPDRSGWRVLQSLKQDIKTRDIPVIVLSVNEDRAHALALGAAEHIIKPADRDQLAATVMRYARKRPAEEHAPAASVTPRTTKQAS